MKLFMMALLLISQYGWTAETAATADKPAIRYKKGSDINFEELLIQGQLKRPEISVVTGNESRDTDGLLRLRENFTDRIAIDFGEQVK
jgi:hypothetical protein